MKSLSKFVGSLSWLNLIICWRLVVVGVVLLFMWLKILVVELWL